MIISSDMLAVIDVVGDGNRTKSRVTPSLVCSKIGCALADAKDALISLKKEGFLEFLVGTGSYHLTDRSKPIYLNQVDVEVELTPFTRERCFSNTLESRMAVRSKPSLYVRNEQQPKELPYHEDCELVRGLVGSGEVVYDEKLEECVYVFHGKFGSATYTFKPSDDTLTIVCGSSVMFQEFADFICEELMLDVNVSQVNHREHTLLIKDVCLNFDLVNLRKLNHE